MGLLGKILLTLAVVGGVVAYLRYRQQSATEVLPAPRVINPRPTRRRTIGWLASSVVVVVILGVGVSLYAYWQEQNAILHVRVIEAGTGKESNYRAYRGDIDDREFVTIDGTRVRLAETERLETTIKPPARN